jgi:hypothetical protein
MKYMICNVRIRRKTNLNFVFNLRVFMEQLELLCCVLLSFIKVLFLSLSVSFSQVSPLPSYEYLLE